VRIVEILTVRRHTAPDDRKIRVSMTVILIGLGHGMAVLMAYLMSSKLNVARLVAVLSIVVAVGKGQLIFLPVDLIGIALGYFLVVKIAGGRRGGLQSTSASEPGAKSDRDFGSSSSPTYSGKKRVRFWKTTTGTTK